MTTEYEDIVHTPTLGAAIVEAGTYTAELRGYERVQGTFRDERTGEFRYQVKMFFRIAQVGEYEGVELAAYANEADDPGQLRPKMLLYQVVDALLGEDPIECYERTGQPVIWKKLIGKLCRIGVEERKSKDGGTYSRVVSYARIRKPAPRPSQAQEVGERVEAIEAAEEGAEDEAASQSRSKGHLAQAARKAAIAGGRRAVEPTAEEWADVPFE